MKSISSLLLLSSAVLREANGQTWCDETLECAGETVDDELIYCWGYNACANSYIEGGLCDCAGFSSCFGSETALSGDVFCESEDACALAEIQNGGNLYCGGYYSCAGASPINTSGIIECPGEAACRYAEVEIASEGMYCFGDYGCWYTKIGGTDLVYSWGYRSTYFADIDTTGVDTFTVSFAGYYSGYQAQLVCATNSTCNVNCDQSTSCDGVVMFCYGDCNLDCDDDYDCPTVLYFDDDADYATKLRWEEQIESKQVLRKKHAQAFGELMEEINGNGKDMSSNAYKKEKLTKLAAFDSKVEDELKEWSKTYDVHFDPEKGKNGENMKNLDLTVAPASVIRRSNVMGRNAMRHSNGDSNSGLFIPFGTLTAMGVLFVVSLIANGYLICKKNNKKLSEYQDYPSYQSLSS